MEQLTNEQIDQASKYYLMLARPCAKSEFSNAEDVFQRLCAQAKASNVADPILTRLDLIGELTSPEYISRLRGVMGPGANSGGEVAHLQNIAMTLQVELGRQESEVTRLSRVFKDHTQAVQEFLSELCETAGVIVPEEANIEQTLPLIIKRVRDNRELLSKWQGANEALTITKHRAEANAREVERLTKIVINARLADIASNPTQSLCPKCGADWNLK